MRTINEMETNMTDVLRRQQEMKKKENKNWLSEEMCFENRFVCYRQESDQ
jgi:hypothetical protein